MDGGLNTLASDDYMVVDNGKYWFALTNDVAFYKLLIKANNEEITDSEIDELLKEAKEKSFAKEIANNGKGISVGISNANDHYEYQVIRLYK